MRSAALNQFCGWVEHTAASQLIQATPWIVPTVQTIHILAVAAAMSATLMINLRLVGTLGCDQPLMRVSARFRPVIWWAMPVLLLTGAVMITGEPARSLANPVFQLKMLLLVSALGVSLGLQATLDRDANYWDRSKSRRGAGIAVGAMSLCLWSGIVFAGRWIAYT